MHTDLRPTLSSLYFGASRGLPATESTVILGADYGPNETGFSMRGAGDTDRDGFDDLVFSNSERYAIYLFNDVERKGLGWTLGWPHLIREGRVGDANALPPIVTADGRDAGVTFKDGALWVQGVRRFSFAELCRPPLPPSRTPRPPRGG